MAASDPLEQRKVGRPTKFKPEMVEQAEKVIIFPTPNMPEFVTDNPKSEVWDVADPFYQSGDRRALLRRARDDIAVRIKELLDESRTV